MPRSGPVTVFQVLSVFMRPNVRHGPSVPTGPRSITR